MYIIEVEFLNGSKMYFEALSMQTGSGEVFYTKDKKNAFKFTEHGDAEDIGNELFDHDDDIHEISVMEFEDNNGGI